MIEFSKDTLIGFADIFIISLVIQAGCVVLGRLSYRKQPVQRQKCLQYGFICSNAGFLGNPVAEGVFGSMGLALASIYLIPQRVMMWSSGLAIFSGTTDRKAILKKRADSSLYHCLRNRTCPYVYPGTASGFS